MPWPPERPLLRRRFLMISAAALLAAGFGSTLLIFYPGVMTYDAKFVYEDIAKGTLGDWQSPVMGSLWGLIDPIAPGAGSMFLLIVTTYWAGFGVLCLLLTVPTAVLLAFWLVLREVLELPEKLRSYPGATRARLGAQRDRR